MSRKLASLGHDARLMPAKCIGFLRTELPTILATRTDVDGRYADAPAIEDITVHRKVSYFPFAFSPGGERANLILSKRARRRTASGVHLSRVAIAAVLSPAAPIDRSSPSSSGVHVCLGALISSP